MRSSRSSPAGRRTPDELADTSLRESPSSRRHRAIRHVLGAGAAGRSSSIRAAALTPAVKELSTDPAGAVAAGSTRSASLLTSRLRLGEGALTNLYADRLSSCRCLPSSHRVGTAILPSISGRSSAAGPFASESRRGLRSRHAAHPAGNARFSAPLFRSSPRSSGLASTQASEPRPAVMAIRPGLPHTCARCDAWLLRPQGRRRGHIAIAI